MSEKTFTAKKIGVELSRAFGSDAAYIQRQVRHWQKLGFLEPVEFKGNGANATALFSFADLCKASFFSSLTKLRWEANELQAINDDLYPELKRDLVTNVLNLNLPGQPKSYKGDGFVSSEGLIADAIRGVRAGEDWSFVVTVYADGKYRGELEWLAKARREKNSSNEILANYSEAVGISKATEIARTTISLNSIIEPLLELE